MAITQGNNNGAQAAAAANEVAVFEAERSRLITNIQIEMSQVISNVTILNRNLETIITIGQEFGQLSQLWKHFHASAFQLAEEERFERETAAWTTNVQSADEGQRGEGGEEGREGGEVEGEYLDARYVGEGGEQQDDDEEHYQEDEREQDEEQEL
ncbi:MAG: DASH complex subunit Dad1-domain-containing protein [Linnemannia gamsii]|nr:MAG: DASH complex subunit Dad1-domain-containing protein [Linnemannia gamsii]